MIRQPNLRDQSDSEDNLSRSVSIDGLGPLPILTLAVWCGLVSGLLEVGITVLRKWLIDLNHFYWMSRHFVWLIPVTNLVISLALGVISVLVVSLWRRGSIIVIPWLFCAFTLLPLVWTALPRIYGPAGFILVLGMAARLVPWLQPNAARLHRLVKWSLPILLGLLLILVVAAWARDPIREWRQQSRPIPPPGSPNLLLIVLDTVGADHLSLHGYNRPTSPTLDGLARRGIRFDRARATASWTLPSHASMFTGRWPHECTVQAEY